MLGAQLPVLKPALIRCCCVALDQTAVKKTLWEKIVRSKDLTSLSCIQVQALSLPVLCSSYACACLCIMLVLVLLLTHWPDFLAWSSDLPHCYGLFWPSGLLADRGYCHQTCSAALAQGLWDCAARWGCCPSYLGPPLAHLPLQSSPSTLTEQPTLVPPWPWDEELQKLLLLSYKVFWCICCGLCEYFGMHFIYKVTMSILINKQQLGTTLHLRGPMAHQTGVCTA